jgi:transposase
MGVESAGMHRRRITRRGGFHASTTRTALDLGIGRGHCPHPDVSCPDGPRARTLACSLAGRAGLERGHGRPCPRPRSTHHRRLARGVSQAGSGESHLRAERRLPPALNAAQQATLAVALRTTPRAVGVPLATWTWRAVAHYLQAQFGIRLSRTSCWRYLHRLGFVCKWPKKQFAKADPELRAAFVRTYAGIEEEAQATGASIFFTDEAHFRADAELTRLWVPKGEPAVVPSSSPRWGEKAAYYSAVCLERGVVEVMPLTGASSAATSVAFLEQLRARHPEPLIVIWDNGPAHRGPELRAYLETPGLDLRLVALPPYSPDYNADEAIWKWARAEVTANTCWGSAERLHAALTPFFAGLAARTDELTRRCRTRLHAEVALLRDATSENREHGHFTCASV